MSCTCLLYTSFSDYQHLNEFDSANQIARQFGTNHHEISIKKKDMIDYLPKMIHSQDEPIADWVCIPLYFVSKLAHDNGMKVVQVGEGSDEQFCGYSGYMAYLKTVSYTHLDVYKRQRWTVPI